MRLADAADVLGVWTVIKTCICVIAVYAWIVFVTLRCLKK